jgi:hypothetical protein
MIEKTYYCIGIEAITFYEDAGEDVQYYAFNASFELVSPVAFDVLPFPTEEMAIEYATKYARGYITETLDNIVNALMGSHFESFSLKVFPITTKMGEPKGFELI